MSDQHSRSGEVDEDTEAQPMLVLGERGPEVQDTTVEELRRERAELLREREEAQERIRAERERAEAELEAERRRTEQELIERQRRIDDAERDLLATEQRLLRQAKRSGTTHQVPRVTWSSTTPLPPRGRLRAKGAAGLLAGIVAASAVVALASAGTPPSEDEMREYATLAEGQLAWDDAARAVDDLIVTRMEQAGSVPSVAAVAQIEEQAEQVVDLIEVAQTVVPLPYSTGTGPSVTAVRAIAVDRSPAAVRPVTEWQSVRSSLSSTTAAQREIAAATDAMRPGSARAWWALGAMLLAVAGLAWLASKDRAYIALALLAVAGVTGVAGMVYLGSYQQAGSLAENAAARQEVAQDHRQTSDAQRRDLRTVFGLERITLGAEDYWTRDWHLDLEGVPEGVAQNYLDVRAGFADLDADEQLTQTADLVDALAPVWDQRREELAAASTAVVDAAEDAPGVAALLLTTLATVGLACAAVFAPAHRPDQLRTTSSLPRGAPPGVRRPRDRRAKGQGRRHSRIERAHPNDQVRNTHRNTPVRGRAGHRGGR